MISADESTPSRTRSILVTDSGLGGLSVFNEIANRLEQGSPWETVKLVYFNAWPAPHRGYNHFETKERRVRVFNNALYAMAKFDPDVILIACNTLSVIYPHTPFCHASQIRVDGIVDHGVQMLHENLMADPESMALILGTPTTINAGSHEKQLVRLGIAKERIVNIACTNLAGWIERAPFSSEVNEMIETFIQEAGVKLGSFTGNVYAALCCTHFGYRQTCFEQAFAKYVNAKVSVLNPNIRMAGQMFASSNKLPSSPTKIERHIVSKAVWTEEQVRAYLRLLSGISVPTREALLNYKLDPQLFSVDA